MTPGGTIFFKCRVSEQNIPGSGRVKTEWLKDERPLELDTSRMKVSKFGTLVISGAKEDDIGVYQCQVKWNQGSLRSRKARVRYFRGRARPKIVHRPVHAEVEKGATITLNCGASGFPEPTFAWYKDGGRLSTAHSRFKVVLLF